MRYTCLFIFLIVFSMHVFSQSDIKRAEMEAYADSLKSGFAEMSEDARAAYEEYEQQARLDYDAYIASVGKKWGGDEVVDDTRTTWVEYDENLDSRSIVDFESGNVEVDVLLDDDDASNMEYVNVALSKAIERMLESRGTTCPYPSRVDVSKPLTQKPILSGLLDLSSYNDIEYIASSNKQPVEKTVRPTPPQPKVKGKDLKVATTSRNLPEVKKDKTLARKVVDGEKAKLTANYINSKTASLAIAEQSKKEVKEVRGSDGVLRKMVAVKMKLVTDNLSKSAALYKDLVAKYSEKFQVEQPLIFAIIEQESRFNPEATSHIPAYGLMQLVPWSGGTDAYRYVYGVAKAPSSSFLYNPENNIELGTAYLRVLFNQFARVIDPDCRRLCVIASYNTGAGNVSRSFIGSTAISSAFGEINELNYSGLYNHLTTRLNTSEARNYVSGVTKRREKYLKY